MTTGLLGLLITMGFNRIEHWTLRWHPSQRLSVRFVRKRVGGARSHSRRGFRSTLVVGLVVHQRRRREPVFSRRCGKILTVFRETWIFDRVHPDLIPSLTRFLEGFAIAGVASEITCGLVLGLLPGGVRRALNPTLDFMRSIPAVALVSVFIVLLGFGNLAKVTAIAFAASYFPILLNTVDGVRSVDPIQLDLARAYKVGFRQKVLKIIAYRPPAHRSSRASGSVSRSPSS